MKIICDYCNNEFNRRPSRIKDKNYCSIDCFNKSKEETNTVETFCGECGISIFKKNYEIKNSKSGNVYCSKSCANKSSSRGLIGENARNWKNGKGIYRDIIFREKDKSCELCGYNKIPEILQVHHKDRNRFNNNIENLQVLCPNCHTEEHFNKKDGIFTSNNK